MKVILLSFLLSINLFCQFGGGTGHLYELPDQDANLFCQNAGITDPKQQTAILVLVQQLKYNNLWDTITEDKV